MKPYFLKTTGWPALLLLLALAAAAPKAPLAPRPDFAGLYRDGPHLALDTRREGDSLRVYVRVPLGQNLGAGRPLRLTAWPGYDAKVPTWQDSIPRRRQHPRPAGTDGAMFVSFCLAAAQVPAGTVLQVQVGRDEAPEAYQDPALTAWQRLTTEQVARPFVLTDSMGFPLLRRYVQTTELFGVTSYGGPQPVRWKRYDISPIPALPPMTNPAAIAAGPRILPVLDSAEVPAGAALHFTTPGLYVLRVTGTDGQLLRPLAITVVANKYPALTTAAELIEPLRYLTTNQERQRLSSAADPKRAVDKFWLNIAHNNQTQGKELIRQYYGRVTAANRLFAAHKAGWLTDMGLLYVVLGMPDNVRRLPTGEERWFYAEKSTSGGAVTFTFRPKPSTFAPNYYELVRRPEYEMLWYAAVEQWRTPMTALTGPNAPTALPGR
jgi:GWxTD domain-containing protein